MSLQSHKYGYCPLPKTIPKNLFDSAMQSLPIDGPDWKLANEWYDLDENAFPEGHYVLKSLPDDKSKWNHYWDIVLPTLRNVFAGMEFDTKCNLMVGRSVTEYEIPSAIEVKIKTDYIGFIETFVTVECRERGNSLTTTIHWKTQMQTKSVTLYWQQKDIVEMILFCGCKIN